jgi:omega-amidase
MCKIQSFYLYRGIANEMNELRLTVVQADLAWEDPERNLRHFMELLKGVTQETDLILLPEMFNTGFSGNPRKLAEPPDGPSASMMKRLAAERDCAITGSVMTRVGRKVYNRLFFCLPDGTVKTYDKRHLFRLSEEYKLFAAGGTRHVFEFRGWKILPLVCYDLRFPVWSKNTWEEGEYEYDLLLYVANWPGNRELVWKTLLAARAIENQSYVAGVNRVGHDGYGTWHGGDSRVIDPKGRSVWEAPYGQEDVRTLSITLEDLRLYRESFTIGMDWDRFTLQK